MKYHEAINTARRKSQEGCGTQIVIGSEVSDDYRVCAAIDAVVTEHEYKVQIIPSWPTPDEAERM